MRRLRSRLTYANVTATLALVIAVAGGTAYAADTIGSDDVINNSLASVDFKNNQVASADVRDDKLANGGLTGADIKDQSGVDTCIHGTVRYGELCAEVTDEPHTYTGAILTCDDLVLRLPTLGEALQLAHTYDLPGIDQGEFFWTGEWDPSDGKAQDVADDGSVGYTITTTSSRTICVTIPTN